MIYTAIALICAGLVIRGLAMATLKKDFAFELKMPREIIKKGIYKHIRHPAYTGSILIVAGTAILNTTAGIILMACVFFLDRAIQEEQILRKNPEYVNYAQKTGMFIPRIWRLICRLLG